MNTKQFTFSVLSMLLFGSFIASAQQDEHAVLLKTSPVSNGFVLKNKQTPPQQIVYTAKKGVDINSDKPEVYSLQGGTVTSIFSVGGHTSAIVRTDNTFYVYNGLYACSVKKGDNVPEGGIIGILQREQATANYEMNFQAWAASGKKTRELDAETILGVK